MKNELAKGFNNTFKDLVKTPIYFSKPTSNEKYFHSPKKIKALELAFQKKSNGKV